MDERKSGGAGFCSAPAERGPAATASAATSPARGPGTRTSSHDRASLRESVQELEGVASPQKVTASATSLTGVRNNEECTGKQRQRDGFAQQSWSDDVNVCKFGGAANAAQPDAAARRRLPHRGANIARSLATVPKKDEDKGQGGHIDAMCEAIRQNDVMAYQRLAREQVQVSGFRG